MTRSAAQLQEDVARLAELGAHLDNVFHVAISGVSSGPDAVDPRDYAAAGATWWLETLSPSFGDEAELLRRARAGPPS